MAEQIEVHFINSDGDIKPVCIEVKDGEVLVFDSADPSKVKAVPPDEIIWKSATKSWQLKVNDSGVLTPTEVV